MWPDRASNPGPLTYKSDALPTALRSPAHLDARCGQNSICSHEICNLQNTVRNLQLTHCILVDSSTVICWMSPFFILGVSDLFCSFYCIFDEKSC